MISQDGLPGDLVIPDQNPIDFQPFWGTASSSEYSNVGSCDSRLLLFTAEELCGTLVLKTFIV